MVPNPLTYPLHAKRHPQYAASIQQAIALRAAQISYSQATNIMAAQGLSLSRSSFYNTQRTSNTTQDEGTLGPLFEFLNSHNYNIRSRYHYEMDSATANPISSRLEQLFFMSDAQIQWGQRFSSSFMVEIDTTFNTNNLRLPLTIVTGISNTGASFPLAFSFLPSESKVCFDFIFQSLKELVWEEYAPPVVVVGDLAQGLAASLPLSMPDSTPQYCEWHAFESIKKHLIDSGYAKEKLNTTKPLIWSYLQAETPSALETNRAKLLKALKSPEVRYIKQNWVPKEKSVCRVHIYLLANLGVHSTQRAESMNATLKKTLHRQITLLEACRRLIREVQAFEAKLIVEEVNSMAFRSRILDTNGFAILLGKITSYAIDLMAPEWTAAAVPRPDSIWQGHCLYDCPLPSRYGLPCRHWMIRSVLEGFPLPLSLVHPRWWLAGSPVRTGGWTMGYYDAAIDPQERWVGGYRNRGRDIIMESVQHVLDQQSLLSPEQSEQVMRRMVASNNQILTEVQALQVRDQQVPPELPPPLPPNLSLQGRKQKGSTRKRALTGAEVSERQQKAMSRAQTRAQAMQKEGMAQKEKPVTAASRRTRSQRVIEN